MAVVTSACEPLGKVRVRRPRWNSAWGWAGSPATAARTLASTMAWRKSGTGSVAVSRVTRTDWPPGSRVTFALMAVAGGGAGGLVVCAARDVAGRGAERGLGLAGAGLGDCCGAMRGVAVAMVGAGNEEFFGAVVQAARDKTVSAAMRGVLPAMRLSLSCARCFDHW